MQHAGVGKGGAESGSGAVGVGEGKRGGEVGWGRVG